MPIYTGKTIAEAKQAAATALQASVDQLRIEVLQEPRRGFLGIGRRDAKIKAERVAAKKTTAAPHVNKKLVHSAAPQSPQSQSASPAPAKGGEVDPAVIRARHAANLKKVRTAGSQLVDYLRTVFKNLGVDTAPTIKDVQAHAIEIDIKAAQPGRVIGHHGQRINALEQLSNVFMNYHGAPKTVVLLDTANYRERRRQILHDVAQRAVTEVVASGQAVFLDPMPAREREQLHRELEEDPHVKTYSHGREPYRSVVIAPQN